MTIITTAIFTFVFFYVIFGAEEKEFRIKNIKMENKKFVKIIDCGCSYTTHPSAKNYGMTNYHCWTNKPSCEDNQVLEVVKSVIVNGNDDSYILKDKEGIEYLISKDGCSETY